MKAVQFILLINFDSIGLEAIEEIGRLLRFTFHFTFGYVSFFLHKDGRLVIGTI